MATPEELNERELLAQAFSKFGSPDAQSAPAAPQRDVRAEDLQPSKVYQHLFHCEQRMLL